MSIDLPYRDPLVRDLAWTLSSPPLLQRCDNGVRWLDTGWFEQITDQYRRTLRELDRHPQALKQLINSQKDRRLGNYFETLWRYWLMTGERYRLLYANLQLRTGERTLGEFDFLVKDTQTGKTLHWEVAVKFYLGSGDTTQPDNWWGPARRDRLDIKTQRLLDHQGSLSQRPEAQALFSELGLQVDETWLILKGRLYYPAGAQTTPPEGRHPDHLQGFWVHQCALTELEGSDWLPLDRHQWLAPVHNVDPASCVATAALAGKWAQQRLQRPVCIARISDGQEVQRGFVVPDDWD